MRSAAEPARRTAGACPERPGSDVRAVASLDRRALETLRWERRLFMTGEGELAPCPAVIDVTGRARFLVFGPYQALEPGTWRASVRLELCAEAAKRPIAVQFGAEPDYTTVDLPRWVEGPHEVEIEHPMKPGDLAQIRVWLKRAAFHGELRFEGAEIGRVEALDDVVWKSRQV